MKLLQEMTVMGHERVVFHQDPESGEGKEETKEKGSSWWDFW